jgi:hypothetical protein
MSFEMATMTSVEVEVSGQQPASKGDPKRTMYSSSFVVALSVLVLAAGGIAGGFVGFQLKVDDVFRNRNPNRNPNHRWPKFMQGSFAGSVDPCTLSFSWTEEDEFGSITCPENSTWLSGNWTDPASQSVVLDECHAVPDGSLTVYMGVYDFTYAEVWCKRYRQASPTGPIYNERRWAKASKDLSGLTSDEMANWITAKCRELETDAAPNVSPLVLKCVESAEGTKFEC